MLSFLAFAALFIAVVADPTPTAPAPGAVFKEGAQCTVQWNPDTSGATTWKTMNIQLMTGDNFNMIPLSTVGTVDGTDPAHNSLTYPCLKVTPHSAIYFYQFSSPNSPALYWTGRFILAGPNGESVPPANKNQPGTNDPIPWGTGQLVDPSQASAPPSMGGGASASATGSLPGAPSSSGSASVAVPTSSGSASAPSVSATPSGMQTSSVSSPTSSSSGTPSVTADGAAVSTGAAMNRDVTNCAVFTAIFSLLFATLT